MSSASTLIEYALVALATLALAGVVWALLTRREGLAGAIGAAGALALGLLLGRQGDDEPDAPASDSDGLAEPTDPRTPPRQLPDPPDHTTPEDHRATPDPPDDPDDAGAVADWLDERAKRLGD
jgi:hypothetical protein